MVLVMHLMAKGLLHIWSTKVVLKVWVLLDRQVPVTFLNIPWELVMAIPRLLHSYRRAPTRCLIILQALWLRLALLGKTLKVQAVIRFPPWRIVTIRGASPLVDM